MAATAVTAVTAPGSLSVIALISGGKDSFYSILHCQANGHRVVALANLYPSAATGEINPPAGQHLARTGARLETGDTHVGNDDGEADLNSFMYQTVGHQIIPLYARATGLPLHRQPIVGTAVHHGLHYENPRHSPQRLVVSNSEALEPSRDHPSLATHDLPGYTKQVAGDEKKHEPELDLDETESLIPLLRAVLKEHPEANALCTGAILSTYQRTRVESVALRLGLVPLSYLWQYTELPTSVAGRHYEQDISLEERATQSSRNARRRAKKGVQNAARDDARLLRDMAAVGLEARIVKVASAGLDEDFLWDNVASEAGVRRIERAMSRFGASGGRGSILGEGGEFETLVVDGPPSLFKGRIIVSDGNKRVIREGGGCAWLSFHRADVVLRDELEQEGQLLNAVGVRRPELLDPRFEDTLQCLLALAAGDKQEPGVVNLSSCDDNTKPTINLGLTSRSYSITATGLPRCELPLSPQSSPSQVWRYLGSSGAGSLTVEEQTVSIVGQIRHRLDECALPATAITSSVIVLRHMLDFPLVNKHYGSLFNKPNPPSRVTISCGDGLLPKDAAIAVYLTVHLSLQPHERLGLHVQSRSYWAPANIGPYSQAIAFPLLSPPITRIVARGDGENAEDEHKRPRHSETSSSSLAVSIAGQIPLLPASMTLPPSSTSYHVELQITLALQHLWRVGIEMQVRWWTSAVAYFPTAPSTKTMQHQALLASAAWKAAHLWPHLDNGDEDNDEHDMSDDEDAGPDLWDRRYNAQFMTYGASDEQERFPLSLPNWSVLKGLDVHSNDNDDADVLLKIKVANIPFLFAAEVKELPRRAGVEWHAHLGLAELLPRCITQFSTTCDKIPLPGSGLLDLDIHHIFVDSGDAVFAQTTAALRFPVGHSWSQRALVSIDVFRGVYTATAASLRKLLHLPSHPFIESKLTYTGALQLDGNSEMEEIGALIPCHSLWDSQGRQLSVVSIFETKVTKAK
ncbi:hypothetical protein EKO27_g7518 [Xylaria grammica]|uniref:Diphthine--ammonia ligase n=1 Tax=Xylaria grammica TaxID=363999 RepID=A0A439CZJ6_9PEZI|nr:hypothetical protein EKO27_g7518 [Xylaria grammica]